MSENRRENRIGRLRVFGNVWLSPQKIMFLFLGAMAVISVAAFNIPWPVSTTMEAVEIDIADPSYWRTQQLTLEGTYALNLFSKDEFSGMILLSGYDETRNSSAMRTIYLTSGEGSTLAYFHEKWSAFGLLYSKRFFDDLVIVPQTSDGKLGTRYITAGVTERTEALDIVRNMVDVIS